jgi:hypothetical protein
MAVMVLFWGDDEKHVGAIELWHNDAEVSHEMGLVDGYYGTPTCSSSIPGTPNSRVDLACPAEHGRPACP